MNDDFGVSAIGGSSGAAPVSWPSGDWANIGTGSADVFNEMGGAFISARTQTESTMQQLSLAITQRANLAQSIEGMTSRVGSLAAGSSLPNDVVQMMRTQGITVNGMSIDAYLQTQPPGGLSKDALQTVHDSLQGQAQTLTNTLSQQQTDLTNAVNQYNNENTGASNIFAAGNALRSQLVKAIGS